MLLSASHENFKLTICQPIGGVFRIWCMSDKEDEDKKNDVTKRDFLAMFKISF